MRSYTGVAMTSSSDLGNGAATAMYLGRKQKGPAFAGLFLGSGGGMWTHFPDHLSYRFTEIQPLEPTRNSTADDPV